MKSGQKTGVYSARIIKPKYSLKMVKSSDLALGTVKIHCQKCERTLDQDLRHYF